MVAVAVIGLAIGAALFGVASPKASAADCDENAIMYCGTGNASQFISKVQANDDGHGHHDLQAVFANYGLVSSDYSKFVTSARPGTAYRDGRIVVDGQTVATNATSIGRLASFQGSGYFSKTIAGHTYYGNTNDKSFAAGTASIPVMAFFNSKGVMQFAVLTSCGNPTSGQNVVPTYSCDLLHSTHVSGNTYSFTTDASAGHNASITKLVYDFGDHTTATATTPGQVVKHTYSAPGNYTVKVTVYVKLPGNQTITVMSAKCETVIKIAPPPTPFFSCVELNPAIVDKSKFSFSFTATANFGNGATFKSADFDFGDGQSTKGVTPNGTTVTATHQYAKAGNYTTTATLHFNVSDTVKSTSCLASVTPTQPPTPIGPTTPPAQPQVMGELVNTGPGEVIAIFIGVVLAGFLIFRQLSFRRQRAIANALTMSAQYLEHDVEAAADASKELVQHITHAGQQNSQHRNATGTLHHPSYRRANRFRPGKH